MAAFFAVYKISGETHSPALFGASLKKWFFKWLSEFIADRAQYAAALAVIAVARIAGGDVFAVADIVHIHLRGPIAGEIVAGKQVEHGGWGHFQTFVGGHCPLSVYFAAADITHARAQR